MFLCTLNETNKVPTVHKEFPVQHYIVGSAFYCATATSEVKELAAPDPRITQLCIEFVDVFADPKMPLDCDITYDIVLQKGAAPPKSKVYYMLLAELTEVQRQLEEFLEKGQIRPSTSAYGAPILFVRKVDGSLHIYIDYRVLNIQTNKDNYPIPRIDDLLDRLLSARYFSKLDLAQGYHQVAITPGHEYNTAFISRYRLFEFTVLPIGLCNAPSTFQRVMNNIFRDDLDMLVLVYLDDIFVYSPTIDEHVAHLRTVFEKLRGKKLYAKREKCMFGVTHVGYLGHIVGSSEV